MTAHGEASDTSFIAAHVPHLPFRLDPLITEAKRRVRRRRLLLIAALAGVAALALGLTLALRPGGPATPRTSGAGASGQSVLPKDRLIVLDRSIGPVRLGESRTSVEKVLGRGTPIRKGDAAGAYYFGRRLLVTYGDHGILRPYVVTISTTLPAFHTASGLHVGASAASLRRNPHLTCTKDAGCISTWAWRQLHVLHHAEPSPMTIVLFQHGAITGFEIL